MPGSEEERPCVLIASEIRLYREGLAHFLEQDDRLDVVEVCQETEQALAITQQRTVNAILLDTGMTGALELVRYTITISTATKVIALGLNEIEDEVLPFVEAGVAGYVCRDGAVDDVVQAVLCALNQEFICSRHIAAALQRRIAGLASRALAANSMPVLTHREKEIAQFLDDGLSNKQIAGRLNIAISTVKNHVHNLLEKLQARSRSEAAAKCRAMGVTRPWRGVSTTGTSAQYPSP
jgi:DNA-binding NarL/FixJ family response regulator